jgi:hypothetical protein
MLSALGACGGSTRAGETPPRDEARAVLSSAPATAEVTTDADEGWSILLAAFPGATGQREAESAATRIAQATGLEGVRLQQRGGSTAVVVGDFADPRSPEARAELRRIRGLASDDAPELREATLAPPPPKSRVAAGASATGAGGGPEAWDLRRVRAARGAAPTERLFTLQIGVYGIVGNTGPADPRREAEAVKEARRVAEKAVADLRRDGVEAYYFHGPLRTTVTVGVFTPRDWDPDRADPGTPEVDQLMERFPHNVVNGAGVRGAGGRLQPSVMVAVPAR